MTMTKTPTTKDNVLNPRVIVKSFEVMQDGSGAPCVLQFNGFTLQFDQLGEMKCNLISGTGSRTASKVARDVCIHAYLTLLEKHVDVEWRVLNADMYGCAIV